jgi:hypothetical protein
LANFENKFPEYLNISSNHELEKCMHAIRTLLEKFNFPDYFQLDQTGCVDLWRTRTRQEGTSLKPLDDPHWQALQQAGTSRSRKIIVDFSHACANETELWKSIHSVESKLQETSRECFRSCFNAIEATIRYERLIVQKRDPPLLCRYFSRLSNGDMAVNNGWVMNWPAGIDFASPGHHLVYMKRHVVAWGDCLKLRYVGELSHAIWNRMEEYCRKIAETFDGIRLDNCHSTPLPVLQRLVGIMRKRNPNLIVIAELFTGEAGNDTVYEASIGIEKLESFNDHFFFLFFCSK